jgi:hypothetical protein
MQTLLARFQDSLQPFQSRVSGVFNRRSPQTSVPPSKFLIGVFGTAVVVLVIGLGVMAWKYQAISAQLKAMNDPQEIAKKQALEVATKVGKLIVLPDEIPTLATVTDPAALPKQDFFAKAAKDDQVLLYTQAKKVYLYRPSTNQLIDVAALTLQTSQAMNSSPTSLEAAPSPTPDLVTLALYNGTTATGLTSKFEAKLKENAVTTPVTVKTNAAASTYQKSLIIDVNGSQTEKVTELAAQLNLEKSVLPEGEDKPAADILIILGSDVVAVQ